MIRGRVGLGAVALAVAVNAGAAVTYEGTAGVGNNIFKANSDVGAVACTSCHSSARTDADGTATGTTADNRYFAPAGANFDTYAGTQVVPYGGDNYGTMAELYAGQNSFMPYQVPGVATDYPSTVVALTAAKKALLGQWITDGQLQHAAPSISYGTVTKTAYSITIPATVNDNGGTTDSYVAQRASSSAFTAPTAGTTYYSINSANLSTVSTNRDLWTGGGTDTKNFSHTFSSLSCGTTYYYRIVGTNSVGTTNAYDGGSAATSFVATDPCTSIDITSLPGVTEGASYSQTVTTSGGDGTYTFSVSSGALPSGLTLNTSSGLISGTAPNLTANQTFNFTIQADDGVGPVDTQALSITITADNDVPAITTLSPPTTAIEGTTYTTFYDVNVSNPESAAPASEAVTFSLSTTPSGVGMSINSSTGVISWTPPNGLASVDVIVTASDSAAPANDQTLNWTVAITGVNTAPVIQSFSPPTSATEDTQFRYQVSVQDLDDTNNGTDLVWSLTGAPTGMTISNNALDLVNPPGTIVWTPVEGQSGAFGPITVQVADGGENSALPDTDTFSVTVTAVNDAPSLASIGSQNVTELSTLTVTPSVTDPDDANNGTSLTWSITSENAPGTVDISTTGAITYTPGQNTDGTYSVTVQVADGGEDSAAAASRTFSIVVARLDADADTVADYNDNCRTTANTNQADNDADGVAGGSGGLVGGDACDTDDDNDGISDVAELANLLDPLDAGDAGGDLDGDGLSNLEEFTACLAPDTSCLAIGEDSVGPLILTNGDIEITATGYYTAANVSASATDIVFGLPVPVTVTVDDDGPYRPGEHVLTWTAVDEAGNLTTETQTVRVVPTVTLGGSREVGEGQTASVRVLLNGESPDYPVDLQWAVSGGTVDAADFSGPVSGTVRIDSGTEGWITLPVIADGLAEGNEQVSVSLLAVLGGSASIPDSATTTIAVVEEPAAPRVPSLWVEQDLDVRTIVFADGGKVVVTALATDANGDSLTYDWSLTDPSLMFDAADNVLAFEPAASGIDPGFYDVVVRVGDGAHVTEQRATLYVTASAPVLAAIDTDGDGINDDVEGTTDLDQDGLLDYLDAVDSPEQAALRVGATGDGLFDIAVAQPGVTLAAGPFAVAQQGGGVQVLASAIVDGAGDVVTDEAWVQVGAIYDFELRNVPLDGVASVVLPLPSVLPPAARWRKYINGAWFDFVEGANDAIASAASLDGNCPAWDAAAWEPGLLAGHDCVRLTLSDGGPNDADGVINGVIRDPSGPAVGRDAQAVSAPPAEKSGAAGAWLLLLLSLAGFRQRRRKD